MKPETQCVLKEILLYSLVAMGAGVLVSVIMLFVKDGKYLGSLMGVGMIGVVYSIFETIVVRRGGSFPTISAEILGFGIGSSLVGVLSSVGKPQFSFVMGLLLMPIIAIVIYLYSMYKHSER